jgi:hypothetical protein
MSAVCMIRTVDGIAQQLLCLRDPYRLSAGACKASTTAVLQQGCAGQTLVKLWSNVRSNSPLKEAVLELARALAQALVLYKRRCTVPLLSI